MKLYPFVVGDPDRALLHPSGRFILIEFKKRGGQLSPIQVRRHAELKSKGFNVRVVRAVDEFDTVMGELG